MMSAGEFRNGVTIELDHSLYTVIEFQHVKPGKGAAFVRTKLKNIVSGGVVEKTFRPTEKVVRAHIEHKEMTYLYKDADLYYFMDNSTYDQISVDSKNIGDNLKFVKENELVKIMLYNNSVLGIEPPLIVELKVTETEPGFKGDTATGTMKRAKLETGAMIDVPLFVNIDDIVKIDTRTEEYVGRANN
jgi:elongation factor P